MTEVECSDVPEKIDFDKCRFDRYASDRYLQWIGRLIDQGNEQKEAA